MTPPFTTTVFECCSCCCCCKCLDNGIHLFIFVRPSVYPFIHFSSLLSTFPVSQRSFVGSDLTFIITFFCVSIHSRNRSNDTEYLTIFRGCCCWSDLRHLSLSLSLRLLCNRSIERKKKRSQKRKEQERESSSTWRRILECSRFFQLQVLANFHVSQTAAAAEMLAMKQQQQQKKNAVILLPQLWTLWIQSTTTTKKC